MANRLALAIICVFVLGIIPAFGTLVPITTTGLSITNGDKTFDNFSCAINLGSSGLPTTCANIGVTPEILNGNLGILFSGAFSTVGSTSGQFVDVTLGYDVTVNNPSFKISDIHLSMTASASGAGFVSVAESWDYIIPTATGSSMTTLLSAPANPSIDITDKTMVISPFATKLHITKDILLEITSSNGTSNISLSAIHQDFSQTGIPEPATMGLLGSALLGLGLVVRKRLARR